MSNRPDIRGQMEPNNDFLHKIAGIIPGYKGYVERENRRDADKMLRMYIARQYREQHSNLMRAQQQLARSRQLDAIGELDRLGGVLQRFIDKIEVATYGYTGMFDPIKVETEDLDQIYAFDEALLDGVTKVSADLDAITAATQQGSGPKPGQPSGQAPDIDGALTGLSTTLDTLGQTWNHRQDLLISGTPMPAAEFDRFRAQGAQTDPLPSTLPNSAPTEFAGDVTRRLDNQSGGAGGWDSRTTGMPPSGETGYVGNTPRVDAGETPEQDSLGNTGGAGMSNAGAFGGSAGVESTEGGIGEAGGVEGKNS